MAYKVIILYRLYMPSYFLGTFTEYPYVCMWHQSYMRPYSRKIFRSYIKAGNSLPDFCTTFSSACK